MKILMIDHMLPGNSYSAELCMALGSKARVFLATSHDMKSSDLEVKCERLYPILFNTSHGNRSVLSYIEYLIGLVRLTVNIALNSYDVVHIQTFKKYAIEMPLYAALKKIGLIGTMAFTVHNVVLHEAQAGEAEAYGRFYEKCDVLVVHNGLSKAELEQSLSSKAPAATIMPHGCYSKRPAKKAEKRDPVCFLSLGVMRKNKGIDILLQAAALLEPSYRKRCRIMIAGAKDKNNSTDYLELSRQLSVESFVLVRPGFVEENDLENLHQEADYCVFPYLNIYGSGALLMAYSYKKPVIASDIPAFVEETDSGRTGYLFRSGDVESLAEVIRKSINACDDEYENRVKAVEELRLEKYNWDKSSDILIDSYKKVLFR